MTRDEAAKYTKLRLAELGLPNWKIRIVAPDMGRGGIFLGKCDYVNQTIYLNAHSIDTQHEKFILNTINHEIAHALTNGHGHDEVWEQKAKELGCHEIGPCATYSLSPNAIDAIRSGDLVEVSFEEKVTYEPKHKITRFQDKCAVCKKIAKEKSSVEFRSKNKLFKKITLECGHIRIVEHDSQSSFDLIVSNGWQERVKNCKHEWDKNRCIHCEEYRLFPFQVEGARFLERQNGKAAIFDEMRLGKTVQALAYLKFHPEALPALFIVKSSIKYQWLKEIVRWLGEDHFAQIISSGKEGVVPKLKCYITSYDLLRRFDSAKIKSLGIKTVVLDEVQAIKNPDATRTQEVRKLCKDVPYIIPLSGTPWKNRGSEFFVVLNMLDPIKFWSYQSFIRQWVDTYWDGAKYKEGGIRDVKRFKEHIADLAIRRERTEVAPEMPSVTRTRLHCKLEEHAEKRYDEEVSDFVKWYNSKVIGGEEDDSDTQMAMVSKLQRMRHILGMAKIPITTDYVADLLEETENKIIVGVHHKDVGQILFDQLTQIAKEYKVKVMKMTGDMSSLERFDVQEEFNRLPRAILVASTLASGEGLTLPGADVILHERQWNPMNEEQLESRAIFITNRDSINATYVHADSDNSTDIHLDRLVEKKRHQFHAVMNKGVMPQWDEKNMMREVAESIVQGYNKVNKKDKAS